MEHQPLDLAGLIFLLRFIIVVAIRPEHKALDERLAGRFGVQAGVRDHERDRLRLAGDGHRRAFRGHLADDLGVGGFFVAQAEHRQPAGARLFRIQHHAFRQRAVEVAQCTTDRIAERRLQGPDRLRKIVFRDRHEEQVYIQFTEGDRGDRDFHQRCLYDLLAWRDVRYEASSSLRRSLPSAISSGTSM